MYVVKRKFFDVPNYRELVIDYMTLLPNGNLAVIKEGLSLVYIFDPMSGDFVRVSHFYEFSNLNTPGNFTSLHTGYLPCPVTQERSLSLTIKINF